MGFKTVLELADSSPTAKASFKSVVDFAEDVTAAGSQAVRQASAVAEGAVNDISGTVSDVVGEVSQALPAVSEAVSDTVSSLPNPLEVVGNVSQAAGKGLMALKSTPIAMMLDDIFVPSLGRKITERNFSSESMDILRQIAVDNNLKAGDTLKVDYEDFNKYGAGISARFVSGSNEDTRGIVDKLANLTPADEVKMTLGEALIRVDKNGNIKVEDQYDFNNWAYYGKGKGSDGRYTSLSADEFEKADISFIEALMDTIQNSPSDYQMVRNLAFLFGSRDYEDDSKDTGRRVEINLGKI
jgi:hypothetical protein